MDKLKAFLKKYKSFVAFSFCIVFILVASVFTKNLQPVNPDSEKTKEARAFISRENTSSLDKTYKKEGIEIMPDEKVSRKETPLSPETVAPEEKPAPEVTTEKSTSPAIPTASVSSFSPIMPLSGEKSKPYSVSPLFSETTDDWRSHEAIDIAAESGTEVCAIERGTVSYVGKDPFSGITVRISHENGFESLYANLHNETTVIEGQAIEKSHIIGYVGESSLIESGESPHLHFELFKNGKRVNPEEYLR